MAILNEDRAVFEAVLAAQNEGHAAALATVIQTQGSVPRQPGSKMLVRIDGSIVGTVGGGEVEARVIQEAQAAISDGTTRVLSYNLADQASGDPGACGGTVSVFIEPVLPSPTVVVIGCGHVGKATAELAKWMEFRVVVVDDRPGYATPEQVPGMDGYVEAPLAELAAQLDITRHTYVVAMTRGVGIDEELLPALLATDAPYIGVIGSRRRWAMTAQLLLEKGLRRADLERVHAPVGLELGAETPREIAVSILAEIVMVMRGGSGKSMQWTGALSEKT
jgi:xanthine dehydrogenase accessory factor